MGETMSLNCGHQRAYCSSPRRYMSMENHDGVISIRKTPDSSTRTLWQSYKQRHLIAKQEELEKGNCESCLTEYLFHTPKGSLTCRKTLLHGPDGFTSPRKGGELLILSPIKIHRPRPGFNPRTLGPMASTITARPFRMIRFIHEDQILTHQEIRCGQQFTSLYNYRRETKDKQAGSSYT
jgi:hypothetical protein